MIAVVKDDYSYVNYDENRIIESYIEFHGVHKVNLNADEILSFPKRTIVFNDQSASSFGRDAAGMDVTADGETGFIYIGSNYAAACYGLDALAFAMTKAGKNVIVKRGFVILESPTWSGNTKYGDYGLENVWRTGHRCGLIARLVNENPSGSLTLADGTIIYSFPGIKQPKSFRGSQMAFIGRRPIMIGGDEVKIKNFVTPFKNVSDELYIAQLAAIGAKSSGVSIKTFKGTVRLDENASTTVEPQIEQLRSFQNTFSENQFNLIELTTSSAYSQEAEMLSAVSPSDLKGDAINLFRSGLLLESSLTSVLKMYNKGTIDGFNNLSIYDLVTIKDDFAGLLTKYKEIKAMIKKKALVGTIQQLSACADYVSEYAMSQITSLLQESALGGRMREMILGFHRKFKAGHKGWAQGPDEGVILNIPDSVAFSVIDQSGTFHPTASEDMDANELAGLVQGMTGLLNPLLVTNAPYDLVFVPSNKGGIILAKSDNQKEKVWFSHGVLIRMIDPTHYSVESYATGDSVAVVGIGGSITVDGFTIKLNSVTELGVEVVMNGSKRLCNPRWIEGEVVDRTVAVRATKILLTRIIDSTLGKDYDETRPDSLYGLINNHGAISSVLNNNHVTYKVGWFKKRTKQGRGDYSPDRMRYIGARMIHTRDGNFAFEHFIEHKLIGWYTNGCTSASDSTSVGRSALRGALGDAIITETDPADLWAGHAMVGNIFLGGAGLAGAVGIVAAFVAFVPVGILAIAACGIFSGISFLFLGSKYKDVGLSESLCTVRFPSHFVKATFDITEILPSSVGTDYGLVTSAISSAASDLAFTKIEPMLRTLKKSSIREMLVMCNSAENPTSIFSVSTASSMFYVNGLMVTRFRDVLQELIEQDDEYKITFELFVQALGALLDAESDPRCVYYNEGAIMGAPATSSPDAFDVGLQYAVKEF